MDHIETLFLVVDTTVDSSTDDDSFVFDDSPSALTGSEKSLLLVLHTFLKQLYDVNNYYIN